MNDANTVVSSDENSQKVADPRQLLYAEPMHAIESAVRTEQSRAEQDPSYVPSWQRNKASAAPYSLAERLAANQRKSWSETSLGAIQRTAAGGRSDYSYDAGALGSYLNPYTDEEMKAYEMMPDSSSIGEYAAALAGQLAGGLPAPENLLGGAGLEKQLILNGGKALSKAGFRRVPERLALAMETSAGRIAASAAANSVAAAGADVGLQGIKISSGEQESYRPA